MGGLSGKVVIVLGAENSVGGAVIATFRNAGATVIPLVALAADETIWAKAFSDVGRFAIFVNAAHSCETKSIADLDPNTFMSVFNGIAETAWLAQKHAVLALRKNNGGVIINVTSVLARVAAANCAPVCAAARGVLMSTKSAALECAKAKDNIVVSAVLAGRMEGDPEHWPDGSLLPGAPTVTPEDVAAGVLFLATDGAAYMTGVEMPVDGGFLAS